MEIDGWFKFLTTKFVLGLRGLHLGKLSLVEFHHGTPDMTQVLTIYTEHHSSCLQFKRKISYLSSTYTTSTQIMCSFNVLD